MARIDYWQYLLDNEGNPLPFTEVRVYLARTSVEANIYLDSDFGSVTTSSNEDLKTDQYGFVQFWIGDEFEVEGGYDVDQQFKVVWQNDVDGIQEEIDDIYLFAPVRKVSTADSIKGQASNKDFDRVVSNSQGYKWDLHVSEIVPSASPHGLKPVEFFELDTKTDKVISNKLGYQMYQMAERASTTAPDISAARYIQSTVSSWSTSGGLFYTDINHNFDNFYPIVNISKSSNNAELQPKRIEAISLDVTRIWIEHDISVNIIAFG